MVTFDEHGGFYDHVPPPQTNVPSPDGVVSPEGFEFNRLGVRIPTVIASPWVNPGTVIHTPPPAQRPHPDSQYEHTSVMATVNKLFGVNGAMSKRASWSGTWEHIFSRTTPRSDCPQSFANFAPHTQSDMDRQRAKPLNDHLEIEVEFYCRQNGHPVETCNKDTFTNQGDASDFLEREVEIFMHRLRVRQAEYEAQHA